MADCGVELTDERLGAYADGELDSLERQQVERLLALDADARRRLAAIQAVTLVVRAAVVADRRDPPLRLDSTARAAEPVPTPVPRSTATIERRRTRPGSRGRRVRAWRDWRIAASFVAGAAVLFGVLSLGPGPEDSGGDWRDNAAAFHDMYVRARANRPPDTLLEIMRTQPDELARLISFPPSLPDLAAHGYEPAGAHLIAVPGGPIVYVAFEHERRPTIGFAMARGSSDDADGRVTEPAVRVTGSGLTLVSWSAGSIEYALSGQLPTGELLQLADTVRQSLSATTL